jgi:hypothetical protein
MIPSRRQFLGLAASLAASLGGGALLAQNQIPLPMPPGPLPNDPFPRDPIGSPMPERTQSPAERLKQNQAQIKKDMARLKEVVGELEKELAAGSSTTVLSMVAVRKTEEIEKLAREVRNLMRG